MFGANPAVLQVLLQIESAFSELRYDELSEQQFGRELANAVRPFEKPSIDWRVSCSPGPRCSLEYFFQAGGNQSEEWACVSLYKLDPSSFCAVAQ